MTIDVFKSRASQFAEELASELIERPREVRALKAENAALREELDALLQTEVGEVVAHNQELWAEVIELRAQLRRQS